jgi:hypothetical protein
MSRRAVKCGWQLVFEPLHPNLLMFFSEWKTLTPPPSAPTGKNPLTTVKFGHDKWISPFSSNNWIKMSGLSFLLAWLKADFDASGAWPAMESLSMESWLPRKTPAISS